MNTTTIMFYRLPHWIVGFFTTLTICAQIPAGYYSTANNLSGDDLRNALKTIVSTNHVRISYSAVWTAYQATDTRPVPNNQIIWDMYSDIPSGTPIYSFTVGINQCGTASAEGHCYSREHSFPSSWWGGSSSSTAFQYTDLHHLFPADQYVNLKKSNFPIGNVSLTSSPWVSSNGSMVGTCAEIEYSGKVFEPIDEYKGDFARAYFYMITRYKDLIPTWTQNFPTQALAQITEGDNFKTWYVNMLLQWHLNDPVSLKEINRNNAIYYNTNQANRNPYVDHPEFVLAVWGNMNFIVPVPTALDAHNVLWNDFTAKWELDDTENVDGFYLDVSTKSSFNQVIPNTPTDLFFSEYVEGTSNNKYLEIYNGTENIINLSNYQIQLYSNGATNPTTTNTLNGLLAPQETIVFKNSAASIFTGESINASTINFNGNDAIALFKISTNSFVDIFGNIGENPGIAWTAGNHTTSGRTLIRTASVKQGITQNPNSGFPTLATEWEVYPIDYIDNLGEHAFATEIVIPDLLSNYDNVLINSVNTTLWNVTGLNMDTNYYYRVRAKSGNLKSANSNVKSLKTRKGAIWTSNGWLNNMTPDINTDAIIDFNYQTSQQGTFLSKSIWVRNGVFKISENTSITVEENINNFGIANQIIIENNASILQTQNTTNNGEVTIKRNSSELKRFDYTLWSAPVNSQNLKDFSPLTLNNRFYTYNPQTNLYSSIDPLVNDFQSARGYLIRMPDNHPTTPLKWDGIFTGTINNGDYQIFLPSVSSTFGYHLVGNPYPSPIHAKSFVMNNPNINGVLYFYRKTDNPNQATNPTPSYCTWSAAGGNNGTFVSNGEAQVFDPLGIIQVGQGFFVQTLSAGGVLNFTNNTRISNFNNQFFKSNPLTTTTNYSRIWLNLIGSEGRFSQMAVGYFDNGTNNFDPEVDALYFNDGDTGISSIVEDKFLTIQARDLNFSTNDTFPLHIKIGQEGTYQITIDQLDGIFNNGNTPVYLEDLFTQTIHLLNNGAYSFYASSGNFSNRFVLKFNNTPLNNSSELINSLIAFYKNNKIHLQLPKNSNYQVSLFDLSGRVMNQWSVSNERIFSIDIPNLTPQIYLLHVMDGNGKFFQQKLQVQP
ncbi:MAG: endonuclease [Flavobacterium sp.]